MNWHDGKTNPLKEDGLDISCFIGLSDMLWDRAYYHFKDKVWEDIGTCAIYGNKEDGYEDYIPYMRAEMEWPELK